MFNGLIYEHTNSQTEITLYNDLLKLRIKLISKTEYSL